MNRRTLLLLAGAGVTSSLAGCTGDDESDLHESKSTLVPSADDLADWDYDEREFGADTEPDLILAEDGQSHRIVVVYVHFFESIQEARDFIDAEVAYYIGFTEFDLADEGHERDFGEWHGIFFRDRNAVAFVFGSELEFLGGWIPEPELAHTFAEELYGIWQT